MAVLLLVGLAGTPACLLGSAVPGAGEDAAGRGSNLDSGAVYTLWIHGLDPDNTRTPGDYTDWSYWGDASMAAGDNPRAVNWDGTNRISSNNTYIRRALDCFCTGNNTCVVAAHSTGDPQIGYALSLFGDSERDVTDATPDATGTCGGTGATQTGWNITAVYVAGGAAGGSELADPDLLDLYAPLVQKPDLVAPHRVPAHTLPLAHASVPPGAGRAQVTLRQDRHYASAVESVSLGLTCAFDGAPTACEVLSATAAPPPDMASAAGPATVAFAADGAGGMAAQWQPSEQGFAAYHGPLRATVRLRVGGEEGSAAFDIDYTPAAPATFTGRFREALVEGSLDVHVGMSVAEAGRYFVRARVEDAAGRVFAFLSDSAVLRPGDEEIVLRLFGAVVTDAAARAPFRLRDLEGFLLQEDRYPDRATIPARDGVVYTTRAYDLALFSPAEWESETKSRRVGLLEQQLEVAARSAESR
jgi:hypothetical protein